MVITRLEELLQDLRAGDEDDLMTGQDLDLATDDEMFELVQRELGAPESE